MAEMPQELPARQEWQLLRMLWKAARALKVGDVYEALNNQRKNSYTTAETLRALLSLQNKGWVKRDSSQHDGLYTPTVDERTAGQRLFRDFADWSGLPVVWMEQQRERLPDDPGEEKLPHAEGEEE